MSQAIRLINADTINHLSAIFGDHMKHVIYHPCFWAMLAKLQVISCVHVHRYRFNLSASVRPQLFKKWTDRRSTAAFTYPRHSPRISIQHHAA